MASTSSWMAMAASATGAEPTQPTKGNYVQLAGTIAGGLSQVAYSEAQASMARADSMAERDAMAQQAQLIMRATQRQRGAARAATAASGARVDAFSLANEQEIVQAGETDAAMSILSGERASRKLLTNASYQRASSLNTAATTLFESSRQMSGWKHTK